MILFIYGKNEEKLHENLNQALKEVDAQERINIDEPGLPNEFANKILTPNIFGSKIAFVVDCSEVDHENMEDFFTAAENAPKETSVIFISSENFRSNSKIIKKASKIKGLKIVEAKQDKDSTIFNFIDAVFEKKRREAYRLLEKLYEKEEPPFKIQSMLVYQLRNVAKTKFGAKVSAPPFVKRKLNKQARNFSNEKIMDLFHFFYETDRDMKLGKVPENILNIMSLEKILES